MMRKSVAPAVLLLSALLILPVGCTWIELASHTAKEAQDSGPRQVGDYKVGRPYQIAGVWYYPKVDYNYDASGIASWYGPGFHGRRTANGETYDENDLTAAHPTLPMPSIVRVTNLDNGRSLQVRINDRGPFKNGRIIDMSRRGAQLLGFERRGTAKVRVQILEDESRLHASVAQNRDSAAAAPQAAPTVAVTAEPLPAPGEGAVAALPSTPTPDISQQTAARTLDAPWPDGIVTREATAPSRIYIQAGSFRRLDYATRLSLNLSGMAKTQVVRAQVGNQHYFRVHLGPLASVDEADRVLKSLLDGGHKDARVVVN